jgi:hypothetical protein
MSIKRLNREEKGIYLLGLAFYRVLHHQAGDEKDASLFNYAKNLAVAAALTPEERDFLQVSTGISDHEFGPVGEGDWFAPPPVGGVVFCDCPANDPIDEKNPPF